MSDEGNFFARWSRRKRDAAPNRREEPKPKTVDAGARAEASAAAPPGETQSPFDPASLPPIKSIEAGSDIRAFLAAGVPADLTRAALRRAWSADPTIRDFIGLSENSWDFNAAEAVPGFGSIDKEEIQWLVQRVMGEPAAVAPSEGDQKATRAPESSAAGKTDTSSEPKRDTTAQAKPQPDQGVSGTAEHKGSNAATQNETASHDRHSLPPRRGHGGALPK